MLIVHSQYLYFIAAGLNQVIIFRHEKHGCVDNLVFLIQREV